MVVTTLTNPPPSAVSMYDDEISREAFLSVRNIVRCSECDKLGNFVLNGATAKVGRRTIQCKASQTKILGSNLIEIFAAAKETQRPAWRAKKPTVENESTDVVFQQSELSAADFIKIKLEYARLAADNAKRHAQNENLPVQNTELNEKFDSQSEKLDWSISAQLDDSAKHPRPDSTTAGIKDEPLADPERTTSTDSELEDPTPPKAQDDRTLPPNAPLSWSRVVRQGFSGLIQVLRNRVQQASHSLSTSGFWAARPKFQGAEPPKPKPSPVYFGTIPRGAIGKLRRGLQECLPKWAGLSISFIGASVTEVLCHESWCKSWSPQCSFCVIGTFPTITLRKGYRRVPHRIRCVHTKPHVFFAGGNWRPVVRAQPVKTCTGRRAKSC